MTVELSGRSLSVCIIVHQNYYTDARVRRYAESLAADGARVDVICTTAPGQDAQKTPPNITVHPIPIGRAYRSQLSYLLEYVASFFLYLLKVSRLHIQQRFDIIHVNNMPDFLVFTTLIPRLTGTPVILDVHDPMPEFYQSKFSSGDKHPVVRLIKLQERLSTAFASAVITVCPGAAAYLKKRGVKDEKITIIYNTPDPAIFDRSRGNTDKSNRHSPYTLIFPGTQAPRYGLDVPIRALPLIIPVIPDIRLQFIGRQVAYSHELGKLAAELGVNSHVEFLPAVPIDDIPARMSAADIGIYPAVKEPYMDMAVPVKVFEFAAMGLPIVATRLSVLEEIFSPQSIAFFDSGSAEQFAARVIELHASPELVNTMIASAEEDYRRSFSWDRGRGDYYRLLNRLLNRKKPGLRAGG